MKQEWTKDWPNEKGYFWFYGYRYGKETLGDKNKPELLLVKVRKCSNSLVYITNGHFMYKSETEKARFQKAILPKLP